VELWLPVATLRNKQSPDNHIKTAVAGQQLQPCHLSTAYLKTGLGLISAIGFKPKELEMDNTPPTVRRNASLFGLTCLLAFSMLVTLPAPSRAQQSSPTIDIAKAYGLDSFDKIEAIRYTFNAELPNVKISRGWEWSPKTDTVAYTGKDKEGKEVKASYKRSELSTATDAVKALDPEFMNDQYWLILAIRIVWDGVPGTDEGSQKLPLGDGSAQKIAVKYPEAGYQPGDTWDLYVGADKRIQAITYHRGAPTPPPKLVNATYEDYKKAGPLVVSMDHHGTFDGKPLRLFFTDVSVKLSGSDNWINAQ
jgi:hypothetical protein